MVKPPQGERSSENGLVIRFQTTYFCQKFWYCLQYLKEDTDEYGLNDDTIMVEEIACW